MAMVAKSDVETVLECYVQIHLACHARPATESEGGTEISPHQGKVLGHLQLSTGTTVLDLARHMGVAPSTMSLTLDRLERGGFVRRQKDDEDRRRTMIFLTPLGERTKSRNKVLQPELIAAMLGKLPVARRKEVVRGMRFLMAAAAIVSSA